MSTSKLFFITGVSSGFGRAISEAALAAGHSVAGTLRKPEECAEFEALAPGRAHGVLLDVTDAEAVSATIHRIEREIGAIDVAINNAGYGHEGLVEESTLDDIKRQFDVNVFGAFSVLKAVLPHMRARRAGRIVIITSMGGIVTMPGLGLYHASKFALEGLSESLAKEVKDLGIHVTAVEPGSFRTDWAGRSMVRAPRSIADYDALMNPLRETRQGYSGKQKGDPALAGAAILKLVEAENPPMHLLLGSDAAHLVAEKLATLQGEFDAWKDVTLSTDFPD
ncbi:MAG: short-chain dehydrogenase/reductase [Proteobacteria bacterium ST_bin13]|nr:MAG: short-chain dehydrogenase/reductase [Proteobacteria bacterium ST_bin13]